MDSAGTVKILTGTYPGSVDTTANAVILSPGTSPGQVTIGGNLSMDGDDTITIELDGTMATQFDSFNVTGTVALGGATLDIDTDGMFTPATLDTFDIVTGASSALTSPFFGNATTSGATVTDGPYSYQVFYNPGFNGVRLANITGLTPCPMTVYVDDDWVGFADGTIVDVDPAHL